MTAEDLFDSEAEDGDGSGIGIGAITSHPMACDDDNTPRSEGCSLIQTDSTGAQLIDLEKTLAEATELSPDTVPVLMDVDTQEAVQDSRAAGEEKVQQTT